MEGWGWRAGAGLIEGQPFDGPDHEWAHQSELLVAEATKLIGGAALQFVDLASDAGRTDLARFAATHGLRALRGNEFLYRARMRIVRRRAARTAAGDLYRRQSDAAGDRNPARAPGRRRSEDATGRKWRVPHLGVYRPIAIDENTIRFRICATEDRETIDADGDVVDRRAQVTQGVGARRIDARWRFCGIRAEEDRTLPIEAGTANPGFCDRLFADRENGS